VATADLLFSILHPTTFCSLIMIFTTFPSPNVISLALFWSRWVDLGWGGLNSFSQGVFFYFSLLGYLGHMFRKI